MSSGNKSPLKIMSRDVSVFGYESIISRVSSEMFGPLEILLNSPLGVHCTCTKAISQRLL